MITMATTNVYSVKGEVSGTIDVPAAFSSEHRPDIIKKAVLAAAANGRQPYGPSPTAGLRHSVSTWGKGRGVSRVQRLKDGRRGAESPNNVTGRRAHPPRPERDWSQKINKKELAIARMSALAATGSEELVRARGHRFADGISFPIVVDDGLQDLTTTASVIEAFAGIGIDSDVERARDGTKIRAGRGTMRNRKYRVPVSVLIVVSDREAAVFKGAANLPGVEVETVGTLNTGILAPGGDVGRLTVYTESAIGQIGAWTE